MSKTVQKARKYSSSILKGMLYEVSPMETEQIKVKMQLAARIEDCMHENSWSKSQFAKQMKKNPSEITKWLSGTHNFTIDKLVEIAHTLGVDLAYLLESPSVQVVYRKDIVVKLEKAAAFSPLRLSFGQTYANESKLVVFQKNQYLT